MDELRSFIEAGAQENYPAFRTMFLIYQPDEPSPALLRGVAAVNQIRQTAPKFVPMQELPDPAAGTIAEMRSMVPPQAGMLLCTVPPGEGMLSAANGIRFVFATESKYTVVTAGKSASSALMLMPAGQHMLFVSAFGKAEEDPAFLSDPFLTCATMINVAAGAVTEVVTARKSNFKQLTYHVVYH